MDDEIIINRELLKAIGAESRISILKSLALGRKTQSQLADELGLSSPTVLEHLDQLVNAGLVNKMDEGRKWKYYELSRKGRQLVPSKQGVPARALLILASGLVMLLLSGMFMFSSPVANMEAAQAAADDGGMLMAKSAPEAAAMVDYSAAPLNEMLEQDASSSDPMDLFAQFVFVAGFVVLCYGLYSLAKRKD